MRAAYTALVLYLAGPLLALILVPTEPGMMFFAGVAVLGLALVIGVQCRLTAADALEITVGRRSHRHREVLSELAAPSHPNTAGRPRPRAPARPLAVA
ncbi:MULTISPECIES: DUF6412 domain-containing protein [Cryobacterium]|uniref:Uncharacterized protein n=1 Tax=Cryobacterium glucosi TaxID=1259175 RepID=A0ABY2IQ52_9MICO|nr:MULTISPECIES: DUF6412 domain-containing protein [Cryobacterium]MDY7529072.1 DUF6412 domain-containing protein [Cryobacterium sp. 10C2]MDY7558760.1 DUF6412 domain-containing protein [Cryobacterium sp. 10C3]MEB0002204.1 DUF6412 domain-containing protein [Cryobacterium sp. RTC2.1]MEB0202783.1 DUF6412 domain-containing protein [Cryobacterium sp. 5I3]MEB0287251.1 DUF6412 domain-containing protein [Cryobacterium sp. 10S3]